MRRFRFRFQRILEIKGRVEEVCRSALGEAVAVLNQEQDRLAELEGMRQVYRQGSERLPAAQLDPALLGLNASFLLRLQREIREQQEHIRRVEAIVEDKRQKLLAATKERRVFEILKERDMEGHRREWKRQEQNLLDEAGKQLFVRRASEREELSRLAKQRNGEERANGDR